VNEAFYEKVAADLPNFPRPVIEQWLGHGVDWGWPPPFDKFGEPEGPWRRLLGDWGLEFLRGLRWTLERGALDPSKLGGEGHFTVKIMVAAYEGKAGELMKGDNGRIASLVDFIEKNGRLPASPVLHVRRDGLNVLDGCHRIAALFHVQATGGRTEPLYDMWVARSPVSE